MIGQSIHAKTKKNMDDRHADSMFTMQMLQSYNV